MQNSSEFQHIAIDQIRESTTNPRQTFEQSRVEELAESIRQHGLIQPIAVRPNWAGFCLGTCKATSALAPLASKLR